MITTVDRKLKAQHEYIGTSDDTKPVKCSANSLFLELDTGDFYYYDGGEWQLIGGEEDE